MNEREISTSGRDGAEMSNYGFHCGIERKACTMRRETLYYEVKIPKGINKMKTYSLDDAVFARKTPYS